MLDVELPTAHASPPVCLAKSPTGIGGFDEITHGGLPTGRPTLVCGEAGAGKSLFALQFLANGALRFNEPGVFLAFEENRADIVANVSSLGYDLPALERAELLLIDAVRLEPQEIIQAGEFDLEALLVRLAWAVEKIGAKRVAIDTVEALFTTFSNDTGLIRNELRRLFRWLKDHELTTVITGERGDGRLTRHGIEEYVSDCVVVLDHRVVDEISTRRLRVTKYRGSLHGCNEYPFHIGADGLQLLPITSLGLEHAVSDERFPTGVPGLDDMLGGDGFYRGSSVLLSGTAGTGKTTIVASIVDSACRRGEKALFFGYEESAAQIQRNMRSVGLDLKKWVDLGLLEFHCQRPTTEGLETHLAFMQRLVRQHEPTVVVIDPISSLARSGASLDVSSMLTRYVDFLKSEGVTAVFTALVDVDRVERTDLDVSSLVDTWLLVKGMEGNGERTRGIYILKSRGMGHSNQIREFLLTADGIQLIPPYIGSAGVVTGTARVAQEAVDLAVAEQAKREAEDRLTALRRRKAIVETQVAALWADYEDTVAMVQRQTEFQLDREATNVRARAELARLRGASKEPTP